MGRRALGRACSALMGQSADETDLLTALNRQKLYELRVAQQEKPTVTAKAARRKTAKATERKR